MIIVAWTGSVNEIPLGWQLCDGTNGTPDLRNRFIRGGATAGETGGGAHTHTVEGGAHSHNLIECDFHRHPVYSASDGLAAGYFQMSDEGMHGHGTTQDGYHSHGISSATITPPYYEVVFIAPVEIPVQSYGQTVREIKALVASVGQTVRVTLAACRSYGQTVRSIAGLITSSGQTVRELFHSEMWRASSLGQTVRAILTKTTSAGQTVRDIVHKTRWPVLQLGQTVRQVWTRYKKPRRPSVRFFQHEEEE